jgi:hypothetical protein
MAEKMHLLTSTFQEQADQPGICFCYQRILARFLRWLLLVFLVLVYANEPRRKDIQVHTANSKTLFH